MRFHTAACVLEVTADSISRAITVLETHVLGVNMIYLFKLIKTMGNNDSLTLYLPANNPNKLGIRMENSDKSDNYKLFFEVV
jgi:hypothetical protein